MMRWLKALFAWREVKDTCAWVYSENTVTGERKALRLSQGYQPLDLDWLGDGKIIEMDGRVSRRA